jgi:hypothetical protein
LYKVNQGVVNNSKMLGDVLENQKKGGELLVSIQRDSTKALGLIEEIHAWLDPASNLQANLASLSEPTMRETNYIQVASTYSEMKELQQGFHYCVRNCCWGADDSLKTSKLLSLAIETAHVLMALDMYQKCGPEELKKIYQSFEDELGQAPTPEDEGRLKEEWVREIVQDRVRMAVKALEPALGFFVLNFGENHAQEAEKLCSAFVLHLTQNSVCFSEENLKLELEPGVSPPRDSQIVVCSNTVSMGNDIHNQFVQEADRLVLSAGPRLVQGGFEMAEGGADALKQAEHLYVRSLAYNPGQRAGIIRAIGSIHAIPGLLDCTVTQTGHLDLSGIACLDQQVVESVIGIISHQVECHVQQVVTMQVATVSLPIRDFVSMRELALPQGNLSDMDVVVIISMRVKQGDLILETLDLSGNQSMGLELPSSIGSLINLKQLNCHKCSSLTSENTPFPQG